MVFSRVFLTLRRPYDCELKQSEGRRADESRRTSGVVRALVRGAEHQRLVDVAKSVNLRFSGFQSEFQLLFDGLEIPNVSSCSVEQRNLAGFLVGRRKGILQAGVAVPELISSPLFRFDALLANGLAARIGTSS